MDDLEDGLGQLPVELARTGGAADADDHRLVPAHVRQRPLFQARTLPALLDAVVTGLKDAYALQAVTLVVRDIHHEIRQLARDEDRELERLRAVLFAETLEGMAPQYAFLWQPWLGPYLGSDHGLVFPDGADLASCALLPLRRHEELIGCLNLGSAQAERFTRHQDVEWLQQLADVTALCLENAVSRARLVRSGVRDVLTGLYNRR